MSYIGNDLATDQIFLPDGIGAVSRTIPSKLKDIVSVKDFGAAGDGVTDDTAAIQAASLYCNTTNTKELLIPKGIYLISATIDFGAIRVKGEGLYWQGNYATELRANTANILVCKNGAKFSNLVINGNGLAYWGWLATQTRGGCDSIEVVRCTEYGVILGGAQNGAYFNLNCRFNKYGLVLANGARNNNFYNFTSSVESGPNYDNATTAMRCILYLIDTSNPRGFGLTTSVTTGGNDRNNFFGGISETFTNASTYVIETQNPSNYTANAAGGGTTTFYSYEFDSGNSVLLTDSTFYGNFNFHNIYAGWKDDSTAFSSGSGGTVNFYDGVSFSGGASLSQRGITQTTNLYAEMYIKTNQTTGALNVDYALEGGGSTVTFSAPTKTYSVSSGSAVQGVQFILKGTGGSTTVAGATLRTLKPTLQINYNISNIVGGSQISVYAPLNASPFRRLIGNVSAGAGQLFYKCQGDENGGASFALNGCTSFDVSDVVVTCL
jgi:hypothetical protein